MALKTTDLLLLLTELQSQGEEQASDQIKHLIAMKGAVPLDTLKYINSCRPLDIVEFYDHLRKNHNANKSNLYINIVREVEDPQIVLTTLSALLTQILLWNRKLEDKQLFLEHARAREITTVLNNYFKTYDLTQALQLLKLIKADLLCLEVVNGHRNA